MKPKPLVHIASPYSMGDPVHNTHNAVCCATNLLRDGRVTPVVPHLTLLWHVITPLPYELWCAYDLEILSRCDAVLRLPGPSNGADDEVAAARRLGLPVFEDVQALLTWADWSLLRHCADTLSTNVDDEEPHDPQTIARAILERIGFCATATNNDSRTEIVLSLLRSLPGTAPWPTSEKWLDTVVTDLGLSQPQGTRFIDLLLEVAIGPNPAER